MTILDRLRGFHRSTFGQAFYGAALLWAALPPLDLWPLAWIAPVWWILLARRDELPGRHPYRSLWIVGFLFWLATYHFIRLPHPANIVGWIALAAYLGLYLPGFVALVRVAVHRARVPVILAAPVVWAGLELARAHLLTGITMGALGHTQYRWIGLIQVSDLAGGYTVDFVMMFVAACLARMAPRDGRRWSFWPVLPAAAMLAAVLVHGHLRLAGATAPARTIRVALVQGSVDAELKADPARTQQIHDDYTRLTREALHRWNDVDLVVWPETMYRESLIDSDPAIAAPPEWPGTQRQYEEDCELWLREKRADLTDMVRQFNVPMLLGVDTYHYHAAKEFKRYNSALLVMPDGELRGRYDKMHLVLFGEYIPLGRYFPRLQRLTPLPVNVDAGRRAVAMEVEGVRLAPNICYETVIPHVIRRHVVDLRKQGREPDVLVNLTNDGWFRGSSELDLHLVCAVFRAVECRKPVLIAANTGFSAWIDADGRIRRQGPRHAEDLILATVGPDQRRSLYMAIGDIPASICLLACVALALTGLAQRRRPQKTEPRP